MDLGARVVPEQCVKIAGREGSESQAARDDRIARSKVHGAVSTRSIGGIEAGSPCQFAQPVTHVHTIPHWVDRAMLGGSRLIWGVDSIAFGRRGPQSELMRQIRLAVTMRSIAREPPALSLSHGRRQHGGVLRVLPYLCAHRSRRVGPQPGGTRGCLRSDQPPAEGVQRC